jgi:hypothetical protein
MPQIKLYSLSSLLLRVAKRQQKSHYWAFVIGLQPDKRNSEAQIMLMTRQTIKKDDE